MTSRKISAGIIIPAFAGLLIIAAILIWWGVGSRLHPERGTVVAQAALLQPLEGERPSSTSCAFGIAPGQIARLNVLNNGEEQGLIINWKFLAEDHSELKASREPVTIAPGGISSFDIADDEIPRPRDRFNRVQLRAVIYSLGGPDTFERDAGLSIEVFDKATGRTAFFISPGAVKGCSNNL